LRSEKKEERRMIGEIYVTTNDLREENKLLRRERNELVKEIERIERKLIKAQEKEDGKVIETIKRDCMIARMEKNMEIVEKAYLDKCFELEKNNDHLLELEQELRLEIKEERKKRKELWRRFLGLKAMINCQNNGQHHVHPDSSPPSGEPSAENSFASSDESGYLPPSLSLGTTTRRTGDNIPPQEGVEDEKEEEAKGAVADCSSNPLALEMESRSEILQLLSEKNFWMNQTLSLRKEVKHLTSHLSVLSKSGPPVPSSPSLPPSHPFPSIRVLQLSEVTHNQ
jgi:hypothetical protein